MLSSNAVLAEDSYQILTSIKPLALIAHEITTGTSLKVDYLQIPTASEHNYALKISDIKRLNKASLVIWLGSDAEPHMEASMRSMSGSGKSKKSLALLEVMPDALEHAEAEEEEHHPGMVDPHVWLNPILAKQLAEHIAGRLGEIYPTQRPQFDSNLLKFEQKMIILNKLTTNALEPYRNRAFITQHNAYRYFTDQYRLSQIGVLHAHTETAMSLKHLDSLQGTVNKHIKDGGLCIFFEPQFTNVKLPPAFSTNQFVRGKLDPLGVDADSYEQLIHNLTNGFVSCFEQIKRRPDLSQAL